MGNPKLYVLSCGFICLERAFILHFGTKEDRGKPYEPSSFQIASTQYFIDHPQAKIVVDLGWTLEDFGPRKGFPLKANKDGILFKQEKDQNPKAQLEKIGVSLDDIDYVIMSHLQLEHAGYLPLFNGKKAKIVVQRRELEHAFSMAYRKTALEPFHSYTYYRNHFDLPDLNYMLIEGDHFLVDGVEILLTPGHTPGYQMVRVDLKKEGMIILSLCEVELMYYGIGIMNEAPGIPHAFSYNMADEVRSFRKILGLTRKGNGRIFFGHDQAQFNSLKKIPEFYE